MMQLLHIDPHMITVKGHREGRVTLMKTSKFTARGQPRQVTGDSQGKAEPRPLAAHLTASVVSKQ